MNWLFEHWYLLGVILFGVAFAIYFYHYTTQSHSDSKRGKWLYIFIWPWIIDQRKRSEKSAFTKGELLLSLLAVVVVIVAIMVTPSGRQH